ncbi:MAG: arylsulfatase A [Rhodothermales bacterium]|jgi:arylsulfatase A
MTLSANAGHGAGGGRVVLDTWLNQIAVLLGVLLTCAGCAQPSERQPNIVLIFADDLGYETMGANGGTSYRTPNLDALAASGMRFTQAFATPLCTPSRVQLMTGKYGFRNYVGFGILRQGEETFAHLLRGAGYRTAVVGKWQLYGTPGQQKLAGQTGSRPAEAGFDEHLLWQVDRQGSRYANPRLEASGDSSRVFEGEYGPDMFATFIEEYVRRPSEKPFFLYYPMALPHDPFLPTPGTERYGDETVRSDTSYFAGHVEYVDDIVGRIVAALHQSGKSQDTVVIFVGDNGTHRRVVSAIDGTTVQGHKAYPDAAGTHVPMIASWPGTVDGGQVNGNLIDLTDFLPTLMEAAGAPVPPDYVSDGLSFLGQMSGQADTVRAWTFTHYAPGWGGFADARWAHDGSWKLYEDGAVFNLKDDPTEVQPVALDSLLPEAWVAVEALRGVLQRMH